MVPALAGWQDHRETRSRVRVRIGGRISEPVLSPSLFMLSADCRRTR